ncbi:GNAT family N-acetyltransferase [Streptomyces sp. DH37]|uniref:GNAT family N-acetyltransferase n=1 Tax=Streptomyces sp. DH37 TaxID=3040122 RepID=UPI002442C3CC|nr:GNAT family N-acetyltransferase [Streptomyces sp. DH37]MDG9706234.1 GNAT family N-acetyltransferase [Streptomyces sp. DH37]
MSAPYGIPAAPPASTPRVHRRLSTDAHGALGRSREKRDRAIAGPLGPGAYGRAGGEQPGHARVATGRAAFARLCDVRVAPPHAAGAWGRRWWEPRSRSRSRTGRKRAPPAAEDAHGLCEGFGFRPPAQPGRSTAPAPR